MTPEFMGVTFGSGDFVSLFSLFFDNLSTLLGFAGSILGLMGALNHPEGQDLLTEILFQRIVPACGIMLFVGNAYYSYQAIRLTKEKGHPYTAQPYGLNTSGGFPFIYGIIYSVFFGYQGCTSNYMCTGDDGELFPCCSPEEEVDRIEVAWKVCVTANFITGIINIVLGFFGELLLSYFPVAAMLVPLAGIGFTWLAINQIAANWANPIIGLIPVYLIFTQYYGLGRIHVCKGFYLPEAVPIVAFGCIAGWAYGTQDDVADTVKGGAWAGIAFLEGFDDIGDYIGTVLPFSIAASFGDIMCLVSANKAGDPFPIRETMVSDGIGTLIGSFLGSPFGTVVYIGHPVHKRVGARTGYSVMNGFIYLILCLTGVLPVILSIIPAVAIGPIIFIFGLMICEECTAHIAQRHHSAIFYGLFFGLTDYIFTVYGGDVAGLAGTFAMSKGSALASMLWCCIIVYTVDRRWPKAAVFCLITAAFAGIGIIHQPSATFDSDFIDGTYGPAGGEYKTASFSFMIAYISMALLCMIYWALQTYQGQKDPEDPNDFGYLPPIIEPGVDDLFDTWWDALKTDEPKEVDDEA